LNDFEKLSLSDCANSGMIKKIFRRPSSKNCPSGRSDPILRGGLDDAPTPEVSNELASLSHENRELRKQIAETKFEFDGLSFDEFVKLLWETPVVNDCAGLIHVRPELFDADVRQLYFGTGLPEVRHAGELFEVVGGPLSIGTSWPNARACLQKLFSVGLATSDTKNNSTIYRLTETGRRFRNRLLAIGDLSERRHRFWRPE
jgi:hypothetical protein